ncbi:UPF0182 family membrane protein [Salana multivorans]
MTSAATATKSPRRSALGPTIIIVAVLVLALFLSAGVVTEWLWFDQLGVSQVLRTQWLSRAVLFLIGFLVLGGLVFLNLQLAFRSRPIYAPSTPEQRNLDRYREAIEPLRKVALIAVPAVLGFFGGVAMNSQWQTMLLWLNGEPFGEVDPQFGLDLSFYTFTLPAVRFLVSFLMAAVFLSAVGALVTHYLYGGVQAVPEPGMTRAARIHLGVAAAVFALLLGVSYWLDRYSLLTQQQDRFDGAGYTDIHAVLPGREILAGIAVVVAAMFVVATLRGTWKLPAIAVALMVVAAIVIGGIYPALVQRFQVVPNEQQFEQEYIQRNINATLAAYGLEEVDKIDYSATLDAEQGALREDAESAASIRLMDPTIISPTFRQLQQIRQYYTFPRDLSVDRYQLEGGSQDTVISVRELNLDGLGTRNWVNDHTIYTHGYGVVAAYGNTARGDGQPRFFEGDIPSQGELGDYEPRIYFGQQSPTYSIVGAPAGSEPREVDYPSDEDSGEVRTTYAGDGGPVVSNLLLQSLFAIKFGSQEILFSDSVTNVSQVLWDRDPRVRVEKVAPFLKVDSRTYPAVVDTDGDGTKEVVWIVDAYTTSNDYPYSKREQLSEATINSSLLDANGQPRNAMTSLPESVNYIRNSVKAVVNAYDGSVQLYAWDTEDPVLASWAKVYPDLVQPYTEMSGDLMSHVRYPEDLFKVQRTILNRYHVTDAQRFFTQADFWRTPTDPTEEAGDTPQPPYYLTLRMPGQEEPAFSLTTSFILDDNQRNVLRGFAAVDGDAGSEDGVKAEGYGKIRLLEVASGTAVPGPGQVQNNFDTNQDAANVINILNSQGSRALSGNLLTLPVGGGFLYVQPVYAQASTGTQYPLLRYVLVAFGDQVGFATTLDEALDQVFGGDSGAEAGDAGVQPVDPIDPGATPPTDPDPEATGTPTPTPSPTESAGTPETGGFDLTTPEGRLGQALADAKTAMDDSRQAQVDGDWAAYGEAQAALNEALGRAIAAQEELDAAG